MFLRRFFYFSLYILILFSSTSAFAQKQFGSAQGAVHDAEGQPIPGVSVIASSELRGSTTVYTDRSGRYRIEPLIPGAYKLEAQLIGFQSVLKTDVQISIGSVSIVDFVLEPEKITESLTVQSEPQRIDPTTTAVSHQIPPEIIRGLPETHYRQLLALTPGIGDDIVAYGASITSNRLWVDGIDITSRSNGGIFVDYNYDWFEEVQVVGNGAPAEYGNYAGVVANFVTRSGGNQFHGLLETFFLNQNLVSTNTPDSGPEFPFKSWDASAQIGGPITRDKLWFFSGFQYPYTQTRPFGYDGVTTDEYPKFITKLTYKPNQNNTIQGFGHYNYHWIDGDGADFGVLPEATRVDICRESSWNATWISLVTAATTLESRFGGIWGNCDFPPRNPNIAGHINQDTGVVSGSAKYSINSDRFQPQGNFSLTHFSQNYLGTHEFKFGVQFQASNVVHEQSISGGFYYYDYNDGAKNFRYSYLQETNKFSGDVDQVNLYGQDTWNLNSDFTLNLGIRWDHNRGSTDRGVVLSTDPVAPRIGFIWKIHEKEPILIKAHYGDYYDALLTRQFALLSDQEFGRQFQRFDSSTQEWHTTDRTQNTYLSEPNIKHPFVRQFIIGADQELPAGIAAGIHYIYRKWRNILEDVDTNSVYEPVLFVNPVTGELITVYSRLSNSQTYTTLTNPQGLFRRYDGIEIYVDRRLLNQLALSGSFVYSRTRGNIPNSREVFNSGFTSFLNDPNSLINFTGRLVNDPTFAWKVSGTYNFHFGMNLGWFYRHQTGDTWEPLVLLPKNIVNQRGRIFGLPRGSFRLPSQNILDMRVEKQFLMLNGQLRVTADIFNVFNAGYVTGVDPIWNSETYGQSTSFVDPREIRLGLRYTF